MTEKEESIQLGQAREEQVVLAHETMVEGLVLTLREEMSELKAEAVRAVADLQFAEPARQATLQAKEETLRAIEQTKRHRMTLAFSVLVDVSILVMGGALTAWMYREDQTVTWFFPLAMLLVVARHAGPGVKAVIDHAIDRIWR